MKSAAFIKPNRLRGRFACPLKAKDAIPVTLARERKKYDLRIDPRTTLLDCLRTSCISHWIEEGMRSSVNAGVYVQINGRRVNSCLCFAAMYQGDDITTIEGLRQPENLHAMQTAFVAHDAYQCGYCTSGQIMSAVALLQGTMRTGRRRGERIHERQYLSLWRLSKHCERDSECAAKPQNAETGDENFRAHARRRQRSSRFLRQRRRRRHNRERKFASLPAVRR